MALTLYGRANRLERAHFLDAAARLGLRDRAAARMIDDVTEAAHGWTDRCADIGFTPRQTELLEGMLRPASQVCNARRCDPYRALRPSPNGERRRNLWSALGR
jgi:hypothetical protein